MNKLEKRIVSLSYKHQLAHLGSCLNAVNLIDAIYQNKKKDEPFILSCGHTGLALYVVLEEYEGKDAEELLKKYGTHPSRNLQDGIYCSTGSLGMGLPVAVGMALANRQKNVYVLSSDGELAEGSCWEALRIAGEQRLENLRLTVMANGYGAYGKIDVDWLDWRLQHFYPCLVVKTNLFAYPDFLQGLEGHYHILTKEEYEKIIKT